MENGGEIISENDEILDNTGAQKSKDIELTDSTNQTEWIVVQSVKIKTDTTSQHHNITISQSRKELTEKWQKSSIHEYVSPKNKGCKTNN